MKKFSSTAFGPFPFLFFFVSGFCSLLYQVVWLRLALAHFGIITPVLSVVVSVFMLGLSLGSWVAGRWVGSFTERLGWLAIYGYAASEAGIGIGAWVVPRLFKIGETLLLTGGDMGSTRYLAGSAMAIALALLPWCFLMGTTFPFMLAALKDRNPGQTTGFSHLYLSNLLGALCGTLLSAWVLIEALGFRNTLFLAGLLNFSLAALAVAWGAPKRSPGRHKLAANVSDPMPMRGPRPETLSPAFVLALLFITGLTSMALEVIWTRLFTPVLGTTIYAFAFVLAVYLLANALGSARYRRDLKQNQTVPLPKLLAFLAVSLFFPIVLNDPRFHLGTFGILISLVPLCTAWGYVMPLVMDAYSQGKPDLVGKAYAVNTVGCILGPLAASYFFLPGWGAKTSMVLLAVPILAIFGMVAHRLNSTIRWTVTGLLIALLICSVGVSASYEDYLLSLDPTAVIHRDSTATVISAGYGLKKRLLVNGIPITQLNLIPKVTAHLPMAFLERSPRAALAICFGMGTTFRSLASWNVPATGVDVVPGVLGAFDYYFDDAPELRRNLRHRLVVDDGRRFLMRTRETFDVITLDPPIPVESAGLSLLYSKEFYAVLKTRLAPDGILQQSFNGGSENIREAVLRSLLASFPYVKAYESEGGWVIHFLASQSPLRAPRPGTFIARMPAGARVDLMEWETEKDIYKTVRRILDREKPIASLMKLGPEVLITDDKPYNEYYFLRESWRRFRKLCRILKA